MAGEVVGEYTGSIFVSSVTLKDDMYAMDIRVPYQRFAQRVGFVQLNALTVANEISRINDYRGLDQQANVKIVTVSCFVI